MTMMSAALVSDAWGPEVAGTCASAGIAKPRAIRLTNGNCLKRAIGRILPVWTNFSLSAPVLCRENSLAHGTHGVRLRASEPAVCVASRQSTSSEVGKNFISIDRKDTPCAASAHGSLDASSLFDERESNRRYIPKIR
jgi:hypothetical protein